MQETTSKDRKPVVVSYCAIFLRAEMQHIYRQVTGLRRHRSVVIAETRECEDLYPFEHLLLLPRPAMNPFARLWKKFALREPSFVYRGNYDALASTVARSDADLMHVYFGHSGAHILPFLERWDRPCVVSFHGVDAMPRPQHPDYEPKLRRLFDVAALVLVRSESLRNVLVARGCPAEKIRLNRTSVPLDAFPLAERSVPQDGSWQLLQASRLIEKKGLDGTLRAFAGVQERFPKARLVIAGEGPLQSSLEELAGELGIREAVRFAGFQRPAELGNLMAQSHIFVHPSRLTKGQDQEGVPNSMLEAMATGLPVVATLHGGIPEAVRHGETGLLCAENDSDAIRGALLQLLENPEQLLAMGAAAAQSVREEFSPDTQIARLEDAYEEARASRPR